MSDPRIGVCTPDRGGLVPWLFLWLNVRIAGGSPVRISPRRASRDRRIADMEGIAGLIISGGSDISPGLYGEKPASEEFLNEAKRAVRRSRWWVHAVRLAAAVLTYILRRVGGLKRTPTHDPSRDDLEVRLIRKALERGLPMLGICRGMQLINVVHGGTLHQDVADFYEDVKNPYTVLPHKDVEVEPDSALLRVLERPRLRVNAMHHQAVDAVGRGLRIVARDMAGVAQALEGTEGSLVLGVQWHPEFLLQMQSQRRIFRALVRASA